MFKNIRYKIAALLSVLLLAAPLAAPALVSAAQTPSTPPAANINDNLCNGANLDLTAKGTCSTTTSGSTGTVNGIVHDIINIFSLIVGIIAVIMIIVGGFRYVTSGGASDSVSGAKNTIIYAIVGLIIVALAQFIVQFVLNKVTTSGS